MHTEAINHDPAITFCQTGHQLAGRPSIGAWLSYGLGTDNADLPAYVVLTSFGTGRRDDSRSTTGCGPPDFSPTQHQGVKFRNIGDPVLYLSDPAGMSREMRRGMLDELGRPQPPRPRAVPRPRDRCAHFPIRDGLPHAEQRAELTDLSGGESEATLAMYGPEVKTPGTYAANCLLARRLAERDVRCIQLFHMGGTTTADFPTRSRASAATPTSPPPRSSRT